jgi:DNA-binding beta-propeller fold protein YncE
VRDAVVPSRRSALSAGVVLAVLVLALTVGRAGAADQVFWANFAQNKISSANLDSGDVHDLNTAGATVNEPFGVSIDPVAGRVYWANHSGGVVSWANLDGSGGGDFEAAGASMLAPSGVVVDPAARRIYWSNDSNTTPISYANLDGSGGGDLNVSGAPVEGPYGIALDTAAGRIYWTNFGFFGGSIAYAALDGSGGAQLPVSGSATLETPLGLAIDRAAGRIYWANDVPGKISVANLDGSGSADLKTAGAAVKGPYGVALDPLAGRVYWANTQGGTISYASLDGGGGANFPIEENLKATANFPVLYETPRATSTAQLTAKAPPVPRLKRKGKRRKRGALPRLVGSRLTCEAGQWAPDLVEAHLYRAPLSTSYGWTRDGVEIEGQDESTLFGFDVGNYRCRVTATNGAGSSSQATGSIAIYKTAKAKPNRKKGSARLTVVLPGEKGTLRLAGGGLVPRTRQAAGRTKVLIRARGKKARALARSGMARVIARLTYTPPDGPAATLRRRITLRLG